MGKGGGRDTRISFNFAIHFHGFTNFGLSTFYIASRYLLAHRQQRPNAPPLPSRRRRLALSAQHQGGARFSGAEALPLSQGEHISEGYSRTAAPTAEAKRSGGTGLVVVV